MDNSVQNADNEENRSSTMMRYLKVVVMQNPFFNYFQYGNKLGLIFEELEKTKIPCVIEDSSALAKIKFMSTLYQTVGFGFAAWFLFKIKRISFLNRCFIIGVFSTFVIYIVETNQKDKMLESFLSSMTHYGQESRIVTKYYIPNHRKIIGIQHSIEMFRERASERHKELANKKKLIEGIIDKEKKEERRFLEEAAKDFEKDDFGKNL